MANENKYSCSEKLQNHLKIWSRERVSMHTQPFLHCRERGHLENEEEDRTSFVFSGLLEIVSWGSVQFLMNTWLSVNFQPIHRSMIQMEQEFLVYYKYIWKMYMIPDPEPISKQSESVLNKKYRQISWRHQFTKSSPDAKLRNLNYLPGSHFCDPLKGTSGIVCSIFSSPKAGYSFDQQEVWSAYVQNLSSPNDMWWVPRMLTSHLAKKPSPVLLSLTPLKLLS